MSSSLDAAVNREIDRLFGAPARSGRVTVAVSFERDNFLGFPIVSGMVETSDGEWGRIIEAECCSADGTFLRDLDTSKYGAADLEIELTSHERSDADMALDDAEREARDAARERTWERES